VATSQTWQGVQGASITVPPDATGESDQATLGISGRFSSAASGTVSFRLYSSPQCTEASRVDSSTARVSGTTAVSKPVPIQLAPGTYYWTAGYSGDTYNQPSISPCGSETLTIARPLRVYPGAVSVSLNLATLGIGCTTVPCTVAVTITRPAFLRADLARHKGKSQPPVATLATGKVTIRKNGAHTVRLRLTVAGRRFVASHNGRVTLNATVAITIHGHTTVVKRRLTIKITKPSKRERH
jgi:hypothetical protein